MEINYLCFRGERKDILQFLEVLYNDLIRITYDSNEIIYSHTLGCEIDKNNGNYMYNSLKIRIGNLREFNDDYVGSMYITLLLDEEIYSRFYYKIKETNNFII